MATRGRGRGGTRTPRRPAATSGPGALSQRTDGGPAQPIRAIPSHREGGQHGDRQASVQQQQAAPLAAAGPAGGGGQSPTPSALGGLPDVFGPTERPGEPISAGSDPGPVSPRVQVDPTTAMAQVLFEMFPNEDTARLLTDLRTRGRPGGRT